MNPFLPRLRPHSSPLEALTGLALPFRALRLLFTTPALRRLSVLSALITAAALIALVPLLWPRSQALAHWLVGGNRGWQPLASGVLGAVLFVLLYAAGALTVPNVLLAPLQDPISEATEARCVEGDQPTLEFSLAALVRGSVESLKYTALRVLLMALGFALLWPLNLIPGVGSVAWAALSTGWSMFLLALEHLSNPAARHLQPFGQVVTALGRRPWLALGFGASLWVLLWVPVVNFFLLPVASAAGTLLFLSLRPTWLLTPKRSGTNG